MIFICQADDWLRKFTAVDFHWKPCSVFQFSIVSLLKSFIQKAHLGAFQFAYAWVFVYFWCILLRPFYLITQTHLIDAVYWSVWVRSYQQNSTEIEKAQSGALNLICIDVLMCHGRMSYHISFIICTNTHTCTFLFVTYFHFVGSGLMFKLIAKHQSNFMWVCLFVCCCTHKLEIVDNPPMTAMACQ